MARVRRPINAPITRKIPMEMVAILVILIAGGAYFWSSKKESDSSPSPEAGAYVQTAPAHGPEDAPVVLAKWTDFQ